MEGQEQVQSLRFAWQTNLWVRLIAILELLVFCCVVVFFFPPAPELQNVNCKMKLFYL